MIIGASRPGSERSAIKWLIFIGLLWTQFAYSSHQLAHEAGDFDEACQMCSSFDRLDDPLSAEEIPGTVSEATYVTLPRVVDSDIAGVLQVFSARASPPSPDSSD